MLFISNHYACILLVIRSTLLLSFVQSAYVNHVFLYETNEPNDENPHYRSVLVEPKYYRKDQGPYTFNYGVGSDSYLGSRTQGNQLSEPLRQVPPYALSPESYMYNPKDEKKEEAKLEQLVESPFFMRYHKYKEELRKQQINGQPPSVEQSLVQASQRQQLEKQSADVRGVGEKQYQQPLPQNMPQQVLQFSQQPIQQFATPVQQIATPAQQLATSMQQLTTPVQQFIQPLQQSNKPKRHKKTQAHTFGGLHAWRKPHKKKGVMYPSPKFISLDGTSLTRSPLQHSSKIDADEGDFSLQPTAAVVLGNPRPTNIPIVHFAKKPNIKVKEAEKVSETKPIKTQRKEENNNNKEDTKLHESFEETSVKDHQLDPGMKVSEQAPNVMELNLKKKTTENEEKTKKKKDKEEEKKTDTKIANEAGEKQKPFDEEEYNLDDLDEHEQHLLTDNTTTNLNAEKEKEFQAQESDFASKEASLSTQEARLALQEVETAYDEEKKAEAKQQMKQEGEAKGINEQLVSEQNLQEKHMEEPKNQSNPQIQQSLQEDKKLGTTLSAAEKEVSPLNKTTTPTTERLKNKGFVNETEQLMEVEDDSEVKPPSPSIQQEEKLTDGKVFQVADLQPTEESMVQSPAVSVVQNETPNTSTVVPSDENHINVPSSSGPSMFSQQIAESERQSLAEESSQRDEFEEARAVAQKAAEDAPHPIQGSPQKVVEIPPAVSNLQVTDGKDLPLVQQHPMEEEQVEPPKQLQPMAKMVVTPIRGAVTPIREFAQPATPTTPETEDDAGEEMTLEPPTESEQRQQLPQPVQQQAIAAAVQGNPLPLQQTQAMFSQGNPQIRQQQAITSQIQGGVAPVVGKSTPIVTSFQGTSPAQDSSDLLQESEQRDQTEEPNITEEENNMHPDEEENLPTPTEPFDEPAHAKNEISSENKPTITEFTNQTAITEFNNQTAITEFNNQSAINEESGGEGPIHPDNSTSSGGSGDLALQNKTTVSNEEAMEAAQSMTNLDQEDNTSNNNNNNQVDVSHESAEQGEVESFKDVDSRRHHEEESVYQGIIHDKKNNNNDDPARNVSSANTKKNSTTDDASKKSALEDNTSNVEPINSAISGNSTSKSGEIANKKEEVQDDEMMDAEMQSTEGNNTDTTAKDGGSKWITMPNIEQSSQLSNTNSNNNLKLPVTANAKSKGFIIPNNNQPEAHQLAEQNQTDTSISAGTGRSEDSNAVSETMGESKDIQENKPKGFKSQKEKGLKIPESPQTTELNQAENLISTGTGRSEDSVASEVIGESKGIQKSNQKKGFTSKEDKGLKMQESPSEPVQTDENTESKEESSKTKTKEKKPKGKGFLMPLQTSSDSGCQSCSGPASSSDKEFKTSNSSLKSNDDHKTIDGDKQNHKQTKGFAMPNKIVNATITNTVANSTTEPISTGEHKQTEFASPKPENHKALESPLAHAIKQVLSKATARTENKTVTATQNKTSNSDATSKVQAEESAKLKGFLMTQNVSSGNTNIQPGFVSKYHSSEFPMVKDGSIEQDSNKLLSIHEKAASKDKVLPAPLDYSRKSNTENEATDSGVGFSFSNSNVAKGFSLPQKGFVSHYRQSSSVFPMAKDGLNEQESNSQLPIHDGDYSRKSNTDNEAMDKRVDFSSSNSNVAKGFSLPQKGFVSNYRQSSSVFPTATAEDGLLEQDNKQLFAIDEKAASKNAASSIPDDSKHQAPVVVNEQMVDFEKQWKMNDHIEDRTPSSEMMEQVKAANRELKNMGLDPDNETMIDIVDDGKPTQSLNTEDEIAKQQEDLAKEEKTEEEKLDEQAAQQNEANRKAVSKEASEFAKLESNSAYERHGADSHQPHDYERAEIAEEEEEQKILMEEKSGQPPEESSSSLVLEVEKEKENLVNRAALDKAIAESGVRTTEESLHSLKNTVDYSRTAQQKKIIDENDVKTSIEDGSKQSDAKNTVGQSHEKSEHKTVDENDVKSTTDISRASDHVSNNMKEQATSVVQHQQQNEEKEKKSTDGDVNSNSKESEKAAEHQQQQERIEEIKKENKNIEEAGKKSTADGSDPMNKEHETQLRLENEITTDMISKSVKPKQEPGKDEKTVETSKPADKKDAGTHDTIKTMEEEKKVKENINEGAIEHKPIVNEETTNLSTETTTTKHRDDQEQAKKSSTGASTLDRISALTDWLRKASRLLKKEHIDLKKKSKVATKTLRNKLSNSDHKRKAIRKSLTTGLSRHNFILKKDSAVQKFPRKVRRHKPTTINSNMQNSRAIVSYPQERVARQYAKIMKNFFHKKLP